MIFQNVGIGWRHWPNSWKHRYLNTKHWRTNKSKMFKHTVKFTAKPCSAGLTFRQNMHVLRASKGNWRHRNSTTRQFIYQTFIRLKNTPKIKTNVGNMKQNTNKCYRIDLYLLKQFKKKPINLNDLKWYIQCIYIKKLIKSGSHFGINGSC